MFLSSFQLIYIACCYATVYLIYMKFKATYDGNHDTFRVEFLVVPVGGLSFLVNHDFSPLEVGLFFIIPLWVLQGEPGQLIVNRALST